MTDEAQIILDWSHSILKYVHDTLPDFIPTSQQSAALLAFQDIVWAKIRVSRHLQPTEKDKMLSRKFGMSIMSGVGTGKGAFCSICILWFMTCFPFPKLVVTGPSEKQLNIALWSELAKWHQRSKLREWFVWQSEKFFFKEQQGAQWVCAKRTANVRNSSEEQAETLAGLHEDFLLIIADEASGIPDPVFRPLESTLTRTCNLCLLTFNPTRAKGFAFDTHNKDSENWYPVHWSAEDSEMVSRESIERYGRKYGRESNFFKIRVLGIPPTDADQTVIPWSWIQDAVDREVLTNENDKMICSLDVGAGGDDSALCRRLGPMVYPIDVASFGTASLLEDWAIRHIIPAEPKLLLIDNVGVGWGVEDHLRQKLKKHDIDVQGVNVGTAAFNPQRFSRLRDELWWRLREQFERGTISIPDDVLLHGDLNGPHYEERSGIVYVETKKQMKQRGIESPNRADSLMQTEMVPSQQIRQIYVPLHKRNQQQSTNTSWKTA